MKTILGIIMLTIVVNSHAYEKPYSAYRPSIIPSDYPKGQPIRRQFTHQEPIKVRPYDKPYEYYRPTIIPSDYTRKNK